MFERRNVYMCVCVLWQERTPGVGQEGEEEEREGAGREGEQRRQTEAEQVKKEIRQLESRIEEAVSEEVEDYELAGELIIIS